MSKDNTTSYLINLRFQVNGALEKREIFDAIVRHTNTLQPNKIHASRLKKLLTVNNIESHLEQSGILKGYITISTTSDLETTAHIASSVENLKSIGSVQAQFFLLSIQDPVNIEVSSGTTNKIEVAKRTEREIISSKETAQNDFCEDSLSKLGRRQMGAKHSLMTRKITRVDGADLIISVALILLIITPFTITANEISANNIMSYVYHLLIVGITWNFIRYFIRKKSSEESNFMFDKIGDDNYATAGSEKQMSSNQ